MASSDECGVKVAVRERPLQENIFAESVISYPATSKNVLLVDERPFVFDVIAPPEVSQKQLFDELIQPMVEKALKGFNCTALAYGQTGTGKTYTMGLKAENIESEDAGVVPRCIEQIFKYAENTDDPCTISVSVSFIEIYNEKVYDMLSENPLEHINIKGQKFSGGLKKTISNLKEGYELIVEGNKNRHVRPTKMNALSSRSHAIFTLHIKIHFPLETLSSCFNLVDLAGSERVRRTGHQGVAYTEGVHINQGLLSIGKVLQALASGGKVIPYRDSVLSSALQDSLSSNSYLVLLACVSPYEDDLSETLSTLRFAQSAKTLKNVPKINPALSDKKPHKLYKFNIPSKPKTGATPRRNGSNIFEFETVKKRPLLHSNTFSTPNKKRKSEDKKNNQSAIGLTPNEKRRKLSILTARKNIPFSLEENANNMPKRFLNDSVESITSRISLNVSASTAIDTPKTNSYSPLVQKCKKEFEALENKMVQMFEKFKNEITTSTVQLEEVKETPKVFSNEGFILNTIRTELRTIIRDEVHSLSRHRNYNVEADETPKCTQRISLLRGQLMQTIPVEDDETPKCTLNSTPLLLETPQFKVPEVPPAKIVDSNKTIDLDSSNSYFLQDGNKTVVTQTRRSARLSIKAREKETSFYLKSTNSSPVTLLQNKIEDSEKRTRVRHSIRIQNKENIIEDKEKQKTDSRHKAPIGNKVIAGYFSNKTEKDTSKCTKITKESSKSARKKHEEAVLDLLNTGTIKELQILPQIGLKTAYQIITYRTINGRFKSFEQVSKAPLWRGKGWNRFKEANNIS